MISDKNKLTIFGPHDTQFSFFSRENIKTERLKLNKLGKKKWCGLCCGLYVILISNLKFGNLKENLKTKYKEGKVVYSQSK